MHAPFNQRHHNEVPYNFELIVFFLSSLLKSHNRPSQIVSHCNCPFVSNDKLVIYPETFEFISEDA